MATQRWVPLWNVPYPARSVGESGLDIIESVSLNTENLKQKLVDTYLQKATRIIFLNHLQAVLHETRGLGAASLCSERSDLEPPRIDETTEWSKAAEHRKESKLGLWKTSLQTRIQEHHEWELNL